MSDKVVDTTFMDVIYETEKLDINTLDLKQLKRMIPAYEKGVWWYGIKELVGDSWQDHYTVCRDYWEKKIDAMEILVKKLEEPSASPSSTQTTPKV